MNIEKIFALDSTNIVGTITNPLNKYGGVEGGGLTAFFSNILRLIFVVAGFEYMTAGGDAKKLTKAWERIWQTLLGLAIIAGSFVLAAIFGYILFGNPMYMLNPVIYGPN